MILWPAESEFPQRVITEGFQFEYADGRFISLMSRGFPKSRGKALGAPRGVSCHMMLSTAFVARLERFWNEETEGGNLWFIIPDQMFDNEELIDEFGFVVTDSSGVPVQQTAYWIARFSGGQPTVSPITPTDWNVSFVLDVRVL